jgi:hypothetical protein
MKKCQFCAEDIQDEAVVCKHCGRDLASDKPTEAAARAGILKRIGCGGAVLLLLAMGFCAWLIFPQAPQQARRPAAPAATVELDTLLGAYKGNEVGADAQYKGNRITTTGVLGEIKKDIMGRPYVTVGHGQALEIPVVQCVLASSHRGRAGSLRAGQALTVTGQVDGLMMHVQMSDCTF